MSLTTPEKLILIILSTVLLLGALKLRATPKPATGGISVTIDGAREQLTLKQIELKLKQSRRIDVNTAAFGQLTAIPGIGPSLARRIIEYRKTHGNLHFHTDLLEIRGIGEKKLEKFSEYIKFDAT